MWNPVFVLSFASSMWTNQALACCDALDQQLNITTDGEVVGLLYSDIVGGGGYLPGKHSWELQEGFFSGWIPVVIHFSLDNYRDKNTCCCSSKHKKAGKDTCYGGLVIFQANSTWYVSCVPHPIPKNKQRVDYLQWNALWEQWNCGCCI